MKNRPVLSFILALVLGYFLFGMGLGISFSFLSHSSLTPPSFMAHRVSSPLMDFLSCLIIVSAVAAAAPVLRGSFWVRWVLLTLFMYVLGYFLTALESAYFTTFGGTGFLYALGVVPSLLCSAPFAWFVNPAGPSQSFTQRVKSYFKNRSPKDWLWRLGLTWLAFPAVYLTFGLCVSPIVLPIYKTMDFLVVPPLGEIIVLQLVRSLFILAVMLPVFISSRSSGTVLACALGWAFYALSGLSGMAGGEFFPTTLRWTHGVELMMDSIAYVGIATYLLARPKPD